MAPPRLVMVGASMPRARAHFHVRRRIFARSTTWSCHVTVPASVHAVRDGCFEHSAFERLRHLEPPGLELGDGCLEPPQLVAERAETHVVTLVVHREPLVQPRDLGGELLEPAIDRRELLLRG